MLVISIPLDFVPFAGMVIAAAFRALGTARYLHEPVRSEFLLCDLTVYDMRLSLR